MAKDLLSYFGHSAQKKISKLRITVSVIKFKMSPSYQDILLKSNADIQDMSNGDKVAVLNTEWEDAHLYSFPESFIMASTQEIIIAAGIAFSANLRIHTFLNNDLLSSLTKTKFRVEHKDFVARASVYMEKASELTHSRLTHSVDTREEHKRVLRIEIRYNHHLRQMVSRCQRRLWSMRSMGVPQLMLPSDYIYQDFPNILWHTVEKTKPLSALCDLISDQYNLVNNKMVMDVIQSIQPEDILAECKANMADKSVVNKFFTHDHIESNSHNVSKENQSLAIIKLSASAPKSGVISIASANVRHSMARVSGLDIKSDTKRDIANHTSMSYDDIAIPTVSTDFLTNLCPQLPSEAWDIMNESEISASSETKSFSPNIPAVKPVSLISVFSSSVDSPTSAPISADVSALSTCPSVDDPSLTTCALVTLSDVTPPHKTVTPVVATSGVLSYSVNTGTTEPHSPVVKATVSSVKAGPSVFPMVGSDRPHVYENRVVRKEHTLKEGATSAETDMMRVKREKVQQEMAEKRQRFGHWFRQLSSNKPSTSNSYVSGSRKRKFEHERTTTFVSAKCGTMETNHVTMTKRPVSVEKPSLVLKISRAEATWTSSQVLRTKRQRRS